MKQRLGIAAALLCDPELLILDEPTNGLDPAGTAEIRELLRTVADQGCTVVVSSHLLSEIENIADRVVLLNAGRLIFSGSVTELLSATRAHTRAVPDDRAELIALADVVRRLGLRARVDEAAGGLEIDTENSALINQAAHDDGINLASVQVIRPTLEETFFALTTPSGEPQSLALTA
jgi:ABC-2 type transport system ATP-binding protein